MWYKNEFEIGRAYFHNFLYLYRICFSYSRNILMTDSMGAIKNENINNNKLPQFCINDLLFFRSTLIFPFFEILTKHSD